MKFLIELIKRYCACGCGGVVTSVYPNTNAS